jgi:uncharacterized protein YwqG
MSEHLKKLIAEHHLEHVSEAIIETALPGWRLVKQSSREDFAGTSRFGGSPDVAADFVWPTRDGRSLGFLAQINCAEVGEYDPERIIPAAGLLQFFYDIQEQPWGFDPEDKSGAVVIYTPGDDLEAAPSPSDLPPEAQLPPTPMGFQPFLSLPAYGSEPFESLGLAEGDEESYIQLFDAITYGFEDTESHQLLGHANNIQGDMQLECQLAYNGLYCGGPDDYAVPQAKALEGGAADWRLLFQIDTDEELNVMWGDAGMVYFWIREADLRQRDFQKTWTILQCC